MSYSPQSWNTGDIITASKLNNMEDGIKGASSAEIEFGNSISDLFTATATAATSAGEATLGVQLTTEMAETLAEVTDSIRTYFIQGVTPTLRFFANNGQPYGAALRSVNYDADSDIIVVQFAGGYMDDLVEDVFDYTLTWMVDTPNRYGYAAISIKKTPITYVPMT